MSLFQYLKLIIENKGTIIAVILISLFFSALFTSLTPSTYQGSILLYTEESEDDELSELSLVMSRYLEHSQVELMEGAVIKVQVEGRTKKEVEGKLHEKASLVEEEYENILSDNREERETQAELKRELVGSLERELEYLESQTGTIMEALRDDPDTTLLLSLLQTQERTERVRRSLAEERFELKELEKDPFGEMKVMSVTVSDDPIAPRPVFNFSISLIFGVVAGILIVLFKDWWKNAHQT